MNSLISAEQGSVAQERDGNFTVKRGKSGADVCLNRQEFSWMFGRIPVSGITLRADVLIRLCRLGDIVLYFEKDEQGSRCPSVNAYDSRIPMIRTFSDQAEEFDKAIGLFLNDEGNFNVVPLEHDSPVSIQWPLLVGDNDFQGMFGSDPRDYFANEVLRITSLAGLKLRASRRA